MVRGARLCIRKSSLPEKQRAAAAAKFDKGTEQARGHGTMRTNVHPVRELYDRWRFAAEERW